ncbi:MAG: SCO family protein [Acidobacteria bacterium]|nr:SCO family protein [Acidobacteriota bacterium]
MTHGTVQRHVAAPAATLALAVALGLLGAGPGETQVRQGASQPQTATSSSSPKAPSSPPEQFMQYGLAPAPGVASGAAPPAGMPSPFQRLGFDQLVGERVPADLVFRDETGRAVRLGSYFGKRPLVLALVYFQCPMLCPLTMNGLVRSLKGMSFDAGREFDVLVVSFDPRETPALAAAAKRYAVHGYGRPETAAGWHFLTGGAEPIRRLTQAVGFRYFYDAQAKQFAHAAGIVLLTPQGAASRYLYGIEFPPRNVRLGLVEAAANRIGSPIDQVLLYCFHYDPVQGKYSAATLNIVRLSAILCVVGLGTMIALLLRREHRGQNPLGTA